MNELAWAIVGLVLWVIIGGAGLALIWILTIWGTAVFAVLEKAVGSIVTLVVGIILWVSALILVVYNVVLSVISVVQIANGG